MNEFAAWIAQIEGIGRKHIFELRSAFDNSPNFAQNVFLMPGTQLRKLIEDKIGITPGRDKWVQKLMAAKMEDPHKIVLELQEKQIQFTDYDSSDYPNRLKRIPDPPYGLYYVGKLPEEELPSLAVIGARGASAYGISVARNFTEKAAGNGIQIVSGMARGIDGVAGQAAVDCDGDSFAVLGGGVDICYPKENKKLYDNLCEYGGIISEFCPGTQPQARFFPSRNRIISGLSDAVLVVEARDKSGTLITVDCALEQGRDVLAVPGRVTDFNSWGCNQLIRQGAQIAASPEDILEYFYGPQDQISMDGLLGATQIEDMPKSATSIKHEEKATQKKESKYKESLPPMQALILALLDSSQPMSADQIGFELEKQMGREPGVQEVTRALTMLTIKGRVRELRVGQFVKL